MVEFIWHHSIAWPPKHPYLFEPSYSRFCPKFRCHGNQVSRCNIGLTPFDSPIPKTPYKTQTYKRYLLYKQSYYRCCPKFRCHSNGVGRDRIWLASFNSSTPKTPCYTQRSNRYLVYKTSYGEFCLKLRCFVAMATWVGRGRVWLTSFDSLSPKTPG